MDEKLWITSSYYYNLRLTNTKLADRNFKNQNADCKYNNYDLKILDFDNAMQVYSMESQNLQGAQNSAQKCLENLGKTFFFHQY